MIGQSTDIPVSDPTPDSGEPPRRAEVPVPPREVGGRAGPEPTRYGDWEKNGRCVDF